jgi:hypothetical protein
MHHFFSGNVKKKFNPLQIAGLAQWVDVSDTSKLTISDNAVATLADKSGNGYDYTQATPANRLIYDGVRKINDIPVIEGDGTNRSLSSSAAFISQIPAYTSFCVMQVDVVASINMIIWATNSFDVRMNQINNNSYAGVGSAFERYVSTNTNPRITSTIFDGTQASNDDKFKWWEGLNPIAPAYVGTFGTLTSSNSSLIISYAPTYPLDGAFAESLLYTRVLTDSERIQVTNYLSKKWGIAV